MSKKTIFATIPMLKPEDHKKIKYRKGDSGDLYSSPTRFPAIAMIEGCVDGRDDITLVTVRTNDDNERSLITYERFKEEIEELSQAMGINNLKITHEILLPHSEEREKQIQLFKELAELYEKKSDIYMDITYGTKMTSIGMFSSLVYAEKVKQCTIKQVVYGKYSHNDKEVGDLYNVKPMYELNAIINAASFMPCESIQKMLDDLWR